MLLQHLKHITGVYRQQSKQGLANTWFESGGTPAAPLTHLQDLLHAPRTVVVSQTDDVRVHDTWRRLERVHGRVEAQLGHLPGQHSGGVQVGEGRGRTRICQVVSGHVDGLREWDKRSRPCLIWRSIRRQWTACRAFLASYFRLTPESKSAKEEPDTQVKKLAILAQLGFLQMPAWGRARWPLFKQK